MSARVRRTLASTTFLLALVSGCGSESASREPAPRPAESLDELPKLAPGWEPHVNQAAGFAFGLPPGWSARDRGTATLVRSADGLVVISIAADRTREALALPLEDFASRALAALPGYEEPLDPGEPEPFRHRYAGVAVTARGTAARSGVEQRIRLVVLRRAKLAALTAVVAVNSGAASAASERVAERVLASVRSRPIGAAG